MIEIIYNGTNQESTSVQEKVILPNNIRQIGESKSNIRIYLEDYACTYLKYLANNHTEKGYMAILLGDIQYEAPMVYLFVKSVLSVECDEISPEHIGFKESQWSQIEQEVEKYFPEQEIVGWSLGLSGFDMRITDSILQIHMNHFPGNHKILFVIETREEEETFFVFENGTLKEQSGYYVFYEKNKYMQAYMIEKNNNQSIENGKIVSDRAVGDFRKIVAEKQERKKTKKERSYLTGVCAAAAILVLGITWRNHGKNVEELSKEIATETVQDDVYQEEIIQKPVEITVEPTPAAVMKLTPTPAPIPEEKPEEVETNTDSYQKYVVKQGDTLTKISEIYYGDLQAVQEICRLNQLESEDLIYTGQIILLP